MPELPEVETIVRNYGPLITGRWITAFITRWKKNCLPNVVAVRRGVIGRRIERVTRRAKFIVIHLDDGGFLLVHLRMSGRLAWAADHAETPRHVRAVWTFDGEGRLLFCDARKFGRITYSRDLTAATAELGVEPLSAGFTARVLHAALHSRSRQLKPLLLDQSVIAGLGNIYVDEALHRARLHPLLRSDRLGPERVQRLHRAIRNVLREGIRNNGTTIDWIYPGGQMQAALRVYGRTGQACRACGTPIVALRVAQRGTHICPRCQPLNRIR